MKRWQTILLPVLFCVIFVLNGQSAQAEERKGTTGVRIQDMDIGGMTEEETREAVDEWISQALSGNLEFSLAQKKLSAKVNSSY